MGQYAYRQRKTLMSLEFDPHINTEQTQILLVGCGGTGSAIATQIGRIIYELKSQNIGLPRRIAFIDPDIVSKTNIGRQNFLQQHIDMPKCEVLTRQISYAHGLSIEAYPEAFSEKHLESGHYVSHTILIGAVDNHFARRSLAATNQNERVIWIDSGNSRSNGQVLIGNCTDLPKLQARYGLFEKKGEERQTQTNLLPSPSLVMPELLEAEKANPIQDDNLSCADLIALNEQDLLINQQMALTVSRYLYCLLKRQPIRSYASFVGAFSIQSLPITQSTFEYGWKLQEALSA
jgi:PRTRC genetic system ThiF family protein